MRSISARINCTFSMKWISRTVDSHLRDLLIVSVRNCASDSGALFFESVHSEFSWGEWEWKRPTSFWSQTAVSWKTHIHVPATGPHKEVERLAHPFLEENSFKIRHLELSQTETTVSERFWSRINELQIHETTGTFERRCARSLRDTPICLHCEALFVKRTMSTQISTTEESRQIQNVSTRLTLKIHLHHTKFQFIYPFLLWKTLTFSFLHRNFWKVYSISQFFHFLTIPLFWTSFENSSILNFLFDGHFGNLLHSYNK